MKTFSQFLNESYLREEEGRPAGRRNPTKSVEELKAEIDAREAAAKARKAGRQPSGAAADPTKQFKPNTTTVPSPALPASPQTSKGGAIVRVQKPGALATTPKSSGALATTPKSSGALATTPKSSGALATTPKSGNLTTRPSTPVDVKVLNTKPKALPSGASAATKEAEKAAAKTATRTVGKGILRGAGRLIGPASAALDVADERSKGSGWLRSLAKGAVVAAGGAAGGAGGSVAGPVGTVAGSVGGSMAASKAFDVAAGANAVERKAISTANRQRQSGGEIKGIGGKTTFSQKQPGGAAFISTGSGSQRKTAQLPKTSVVTDPKSGKQEVGNLAFQGGKAVYKRAADPSTLPQTSSNTLERIGRTIAPGAYKDNDAKLAAAKLATARASDATRNQKLGVKLKPGG